MKVKTHLKDSFVLRTPVNLQFQSLVKYYPDNETYIGIFSAALTFLLQTSSPTIPLATQLPQIQRASQWNRVTSPFILTVGELGPADCFLHPLQFWQRLSASEMKEQRESSSKRSESSNENLSPSSHSANMSSITSDRRRGGKEERQEQHCSLLTGEWTWGLLQYLKSRFWFDPHITVPGKNKVSAVWGGRSRK